MSKCPSCKAPTYTAPRYDTGEILHFDHQENWDGVWVITGGKAYPIMAAPRPEPRYRLHAPRCTGAFPTVHVDERPRRG